MVLAKPRFIFLNERSFFTFFCPLTCLDHIPFDLLFFGPTRYEISEKIRALACPLFEISTIKVCVHDVGLCGGGGGGGGPMAKNGEKWRKMAMANSAFSFVKFAIFRQFLILEFYI